MSIRASYVAVTAAVITANLVAMFAAIVLELETLHAENGLLENIQASILFVATLGYGFFLSPSPNKRITYLAIALLSFSFLLRELDLDRLNVPYFVQLLGAGQGRIILLATLWLSLGIYSWNAVPAKRHFVGEFLSSRLLYILSTVFCFLVLSALMDKNVFSLTHSRLFEELLEANAYLFLVAPLLSMPVRVFQRQAALSSRRQLPSTRGSTE